MHIQTEAIKSRSLMNLVFALLAVFALTMVAACDEPTPAERTENAAEELSEGVEDAADEMQDKSAGEQMGEAVEEAGENIQEATE